MEDLYGGPGAFRNFIGSPDIVWSHWVCAGQSGVDSDSVLVFSRTISDREFVETFENLSTVKKLEIIEDMDLNH